MSAAEGPGHPPCVNLHLCVRRSGVLGVEMKTLPVNLGFLESSHKVPTLFGTYLLVKKEAKGSKILPKIAYPDMGQKGGQKGSNNLNLTIDRVWVKKEVKMDQKSYQKEDLPKKGQKEVKRGQRSDRGSC